MLKWIRSFIARAWRFTHNRIVPMAWRVLRHQLFHLPVWAWTLMLALCLVFRGVVSEFCAYGAMILIAMSGIALILGNRRWAGRLITCTIILVSVYSLLASV